MVKTKKKKKSAELAERLVYGQIYRRSDLRKWKWSFSIERHIAELTERGVLQRQAPGVYLCISDATANAATPVADERQLITAFLRGDNRYLVITEKDYKGLPFPKIKGEKLIYNHKRHGYGRKFKLGGVRYEFRVKPFIPPKITKAFLLVDIINNLDLVEGSKATAERMVKNRIPQIPQAEMKTTAREYAGARARKFFEAFLEA